MRVLADGVSLAVRRTGRGPPVVCLTALAHDSHDFDALTERIGDRFELICVEWPGHGESEDDPRPASAERYGELLIAVLDQLRLEAPILIGNSIGGAAAIRYAAVRPVRGLVLCNTGGLVAVSPTVQRFCRAFEGFFAAGARGAAWFGPAFWLYYHVVLTEPAAAEQRRRIIADARRFARVGREAWRSFGQPSADISDTAAGLETPIWVAWGDKDKVVPLGFCMPAIRRLKNATLTKFRAGHAAFLEQPDAFAEGFLNFTAGLPASAALRQAC